MFRALLLAQVSCSPDAHLLLQYEKTLELHYVLPGGVIL